MAGNTKGSLRSVTAQAIHLARKLRSLEFLVFQPVEYRTQLWVCRGYFNRRCSRNKANVNVVIEEDRPWILWGDITALKRGFREHQHLRGRRDFQRVQKRGQISILLIKAQLQLTCSNTFLKLCHGILRPRGPV